MEGETLDPRIRLASVPYAIQAEERRRTPIPFDGEHANAFADANHDHDHDADYVNEGQANSVTSAMILSSTVTADEMADGAALAGILYDDGAGSGLYADTVDGLHASEIADYEDVVVVAKSGGDYASIGAALASISDASRVRCPSVDRGCPQYLHPCFRNSCTSGYRPCASLGLVPDRICSFFTTAK